MLQIFTHILLFSRAYLKKRLYKRLIHIQVLTSFVENIEKELFPAPWKTFTGLINFPSVIVIEDILSQIKIHCVIYKFIEDTLLEI